MSKNSKDTSNTLLDNTVEMSAPEGEVLEFTDQELLDYEEGTLTKKETAKFLLLTPKVNTIIKFCLIGLGLIAAILWLIAAIVPSFSTALAGSLYKGFTTVTAAVTGFLPFSLFEIIIILTALGWLGYLAFIIVRFVQLHKKGKLLSWRLWIQFGYATLAVVMVYTMFISFGYGVASNRSSFLTASAVDGTPRYNNVMSKEAELSETMLYVIDKLNTVVIETIDTANAETGGIYYLENSGASRYSETGKKSTKALASAVNAAFQAAAEDIPALAGPKLNVKETLAGPIFTSMGVGSVYAPLTGEILLNPYFPEVAVPMLIAKAIAKQRGFQSDSQAELIAHIVLTEYSDVPYLQYAAYFNAYLACGAKLMRQDVNMYATFAGTLRTSVKKEIIYYTRQLDSLYKNTSALTFAESTTVTGDNEFLVYPKLMISYYRDNFASQANEEETSYGLYLNCLIDAYKRDSAFQEAVNEVTEEYNTPVVNQTKQTVQDDSNNTSTGGDTNH